MHKPLTTPIFVCVILMLIISSCSIEKRVHLPGYHVEWHGWKRKTIAPDKSNDLSESSLSSTDVLPDSISFLSINKDIALEPVQHEYQTFDALDVPVSSKQETSQLKNFNTEKQKCKPRERAKSKISNTEDPVKRGPIHVTGVKALDWFIEFWIHVFAALCAIAILPFFFLISLLAQGDDNIFEIDKISELKEEKKTFVTVFYRTFLITLYLLLALLVLGLIAGLIVYLILAGYGWYLLGALIIILLILLISAAISSDWMSCLFMGWGK